MATPSASTDKGLEPSRGTTTVPVLTKQEQPETSCPCEVFRPGCDDGQAGQGANSDRLAKQYANEGCGGYIRLSELFGSLEPCPIPERSEKQSNYSAGRKDAEQTVLRPTICFGNTPEQRGRTCPRNRKAIQDTPPCESSATRSPISDFEDIASLGKTPAWQFPSASSPAQLPPGSSRS